MVAVAIVSTSPHPGCAGHSSKKEQAAPELSATPPQAPTNNCKARRWWGGRIVAGIVTDPAGGGTPQLRLDALS